jgi:hypothetical protein
LTADKMSHNSRRCKSKFHEKKYGVKHRY